jgi:hypothetical protein
MRVAVFSDLHGNLFSAEAVLEAISAEGNFDALVAAGDLCLGGSHPGECIDLLKAANIQAVYGNTEAYLRDIQSFPPDELHQRMWHIIQPAGTWTLSRLSDTQKEWLFGLPFEIHIAPTGRVQDKLLVVHANPKDVDRMILPGEAEQRRLCGELRQPDESPEMEELFQDVLPRAVAFGHLHMMFQRAWRGRNLVDVAGCSLPSIDHDLRARFTIAEWKAGEWHFDQRWVAYDARREVTALQSCDMPHREHFLKYF